MAGPTIYSNRQFMAALAVAGGGEGLCGLDSFEDLVAAAGPIAAKKAAAGRGDGEDAPGVRERGAPADDEAIAGIEDPSAENIFASYGFGNDLVFGDDELDYSVLDDGPGPVKRAGAALGDETLDGAIAKGIPDVDEEASAYITDDDESVA